MLSFIVLLNNLVVKSRFALVVVRFYDYLAVLIPGISRDLNLFKLSNRPVHCFLYFAPCTSCPFCVHTSHPTQNKNKAINGVAEDKL